MTTTLTLDLSTIEKPVADEQIFLAAAVQAIRGAIGEIGGLLEQVNQMSGLFDDEDGAIAAAVASAEQTRSELEFLIKDRGNVEHAFTALKAIVQEALEYESEEFDGDPDMPLDLSGADMIDYFTDWRERARAALTAS